MRKLCNREGSELTKNPKDTEILQMEMQSNKQICSVKHKLFESSIRLSAKLVDEGKISASPFENLIGKAAGQSQRNFHQNIR